MAKAKLPPKQPTQASKPVNLIQQKLQQAVALHQAGKLAEAQALYMDVLQIQPNHADCLHLLGVISAQQKDHQTAVNLIGRAIALLPNNPSFHCNLGNAYNALKQYSEALSHYQSALQLVPNFIDALYNQGNTLLDMGRQEEAIACYQQVLKQNPKHATAFYSMGNAYKAQDKLTDALVCYQKAIALQPRYAEAFFNLGLVQKQLAHYEDAIASYNQAIAIRPNYANAFYGRGNAEQALERSNAARASYQQAIALNPSYAEAYYNYAVILKDEERFSEAVTQLNLAIQFKPDYSEAYLSLGFVYRRMLRIDEALASFAQAVATSSETKSEAEFAQSLALLLTGDYQAGWALYERRWFANVGLKQLKFAQPEWDGEISLAGKTIFLHSEQGLGDCIQFARYAAMLAGQGADVVLQAPAPLLDLLQTLPSPVRLVKNRQARPSFDYHAPLMSLPHLCQTRLDNIPLAEGYLQARPEKVQQWTTYLGVKHSPRVGLVWSGNPNHKNDRNRSMSLKQLLSALPEGLEYVCLQKVLRPEDQLTLAQDGRVRFIGDALLDFTDTAALCALMDVVISVDTSVAHLAAALGRPTWVMLPFDPDWRWLLARNDSPWYRSVVLYRQSENANWDSVFAAIRQQLLFLCGIRLC